MRFEVPRLVVAGLSGDGGKTLVSLGLGRALAKRGIAVQPFKKGPDYIDPAWLTAATGNPCRNLDTFMMSRAAIGASVTSCAATAELILVEGNRGLFDGFDAAGTHSTAELAKLLGAPVVLVVNTTKTTRTVAALVLGCRQLDPELNLAGVILNCVGTARQEAVVREAVEGGAGVPVLGAIRRIPGEAPLPGRHLGLVTFAEHPQRENAIDRVAEAVARSVDLDRLVELARSAPPVDLPAAVDQAPRAPVRIAYFADPAFSFYYPENLERLRSAGATLVEVSPTSATKLPTEISALYIGGGFPEVHAPALVENIAFVNDVKTRVDRGLPVFAECGGLMYLARELVVDNTSYPMAGVLDLVVEQYRRPQGHGYEVAVVDRANDFFPLGTELKGHEFHYSQVVSGNDGERGVLRVDRGTGIGGERDGIVKGSVWASYLHLHATATPTWADGFLAQAVAHADRSAGNTAAWA